MPKTTEQIHLLLEMNNYGERDISKDKWYSESELQQAKRDVINEFSVFNFITDEDAFDCAERFHNFIEKIKQRHLPKEDEKKEITK